MRRRKITTQPGEITLERRRRARSTCARIILAHPRGEFALPIFEHLEREIAERERQGELLERVRQVAAEARR